MSSPYSRALTDPNERTIRVLRLSPLLGGDDSRVTGFLEETSLDRPVPYTALSYRWGAEVPHIPIHVDNGTVNVTSNGYSALKELRRNSHFNYIWIDAICINQSSEAEKAHQVAMMDKVYMKAESVVVWLGSAYEGSDEALEWCRLASRCGNNRLVAKLQYRPNLLNRRMRQQTIAQLCEWTISYFVHRRERLRQLYSGERPLDTVPHHVQMLFDRDWFRSTLR